MFKNKHFILNPHVPQLFLLKFILKLILEMNWENKAEMPKENHCRFKIKQDAWKFVRFVDVFLSKF